MSSTLITVEFFARLRYPPGFFTQNLQFDFFNYAGIHRHVRLYTTPNVYVDDITITTAVSSGKGKYN